MNTGCTAGNNGDDWDTETSVEPRSSRREKTGLKHK